METNLSRIALMTSITIASFAIATPGSAHAAQADKQEPAPKLDYYGDLLPEGAVARIGCSRLRQGRFDSLVFSPDDRFLISTEWNHLVSIWDAQTGKLHRRIKVQWDSWAFNALVSSDGKTLIHAADQGMVIRDLFTGQELRRFATAKGQTHLALSSDDKLVATGSAGDPCRVWEVGSGKSLGALPWEGDYFVAMTWVPNTTTLAGVTLDYQKGYSFRLWDVRSGKKSIAPIKLVRDEWGAICCLAFAPNGKTVAIGNGSEITLHDLATGKRIGGFRGHSTPICSLQFAPTGQMVASVDEESIMRVWRVDTGKEVFRHLATDASTRATAFSSDGRMLATPRNSYQIQLFELATGRERLPLPGPIDAGHPVAFAPDGKELLAVSEGLHFWQLASGKASRAPIAGIDSPCSRLTSDGSTLAVGRFDQKVELWNVQSRKKIAEFAPARHDEGRRQGEVSGAQTLAFSPDGKRLAVSNGYFTTAVYDVETKRRQYTVKSPVERHSLIFSLDSKILAGVSYHDVSAWDAETGKPLMEPRNWDHLTILAFPSSRKLIMAGSGDGVIHHLDTASGKLSAAFKVELSGFRHAELSSAGTVLAVVSRDGLSLLDASTGKILAKELCTLDSWGRVVFSRDSKLVATGNEDGTILIWDVDYFLGKARLGGKRVGRLGSLFLPLRARPLAVS
jgi:WD40 repeat protein